MQKGEKQNMKEVKSEVVVGGGGGGGERSRGVKVSRGISVLDLIFRVIAISGTLASAIIMGTTDETLPFFTQVSRFQAQYDDFKSFQLFVIVNAAVCGYLALSLLLSIFHIVKSRATISRLVLIFLDTITLALLTAGASGASAIVYLAHNGNSSANWFAICQNFQNFCQRISASLIGSFSAVLLLVLLVILSGIALSRR